MKNQINKSELFKKAWTIAKAAAVKFNYSAKSFFAEALKQAWKALKSCLSIEKMKKIGREWQGGNNHRIYFKLNNFLISDRDYAKIENKEYTRKNFAKIMTSAIYYDLNDKNFYYNGMISDELAQVAIDRIKKAAI